MSKLSNIRKQIATLEAQAAQIAKEEMDSAIGKVKSLMADFGLTIEHLTQSVPGKAAAKKAKVAKKRAASSPKYIDPKSGKTWSGFGRAPGWIAGAKSRDAFLVNKNTAPAVEAAPVASKETKAAAKKAAKTAVAPAKNVAKTVAKKAAVAVKKAPAAVKKSAAKASKKVASKKAVGVKKATGKKSAAASAASSTTPAATPEAN